MIEDSEDLEPEYEPAPVVTPLSGNESAPDAMTFATACWLLRRYSSFTYIERAAALLRGLTVAFDAWPDGADHCSPETLRGWGQALRRHDAAFERGLGQLRRGKAPDAYAALLEAVSGLEPEDARDERHFSLRELLAALGGAAAGGGERAGAMALRTRHTLNGVWTFETLFADRPSLRLRPRRLPGSLQLVPQPATGAPEVKTGRKVPQTGIWLASGIRGACPNFLVAGRPAPELTRACERIDYAEVPGSDGEPPTPAWSDYEYSTEPATWRLVWADTRYADGAMADEAGFLDEDNAL